MCCMFGSFVIDFHFNNRIYIRCSISIHTLLEDFILDLIYVQTMSSMWNKYVVYRKKKYRDQN